jgi:ABC-type hemin transport system ATPase subunit
VTLLSQQISTEPDRGQIHQLANVRVLAEIESNILSASPSNMYAILSYLRQTTAASNDILTCRICNSRIKFFGLLGIIGEKITSLSGGNNHRIRLPREGAK